MQNETQNEIYRNEIKRNEIYQNETKRNKAKWNVTKSTETKRNGTKQNEMYTKTGRECNLAKRIYRNGTKQNMSKHTTVHACSKPDLDDHWSYKWLFLSELWVVLFVDEHCLTFFSFQFQYKKTRIIMQRAYCKKVLCVCI
jgi:hypothetical protein